jgi:lysophospholipase L1-like esterase
VKIILTSILPRGTDVQQVYDINKLLPSVDNQKSVFFLDLTAIFEEPGTGHVLNKTLFQSDELHPKLAGYELWSEKMDPLLVKLLAM